MLLAISYQIKYSYETSQYSLYLYIGGAMCKLYSSYQYRPCAEVMRCAKGMQKLVTTEGNA